MCRLRKAGFVDGLARYVPSGGLDPSFAGDGKRLASLHPALDRKRRRRCNQRGLQCHQDTGQAVAIDARGRIVVSGYSYRFGQRDFEFATARFLGSATG